jgi:hypothetical protein
MGWLGYPHTGQGGSIQKISIIINIIKENFL